MDNRLICQWLGLPPTPWPPDHYTLLGLPPGEGDVARIEQHAQERLTRLRCYQISNPEQATEAMNRLAQALVCLTDRAAKQRYDASLGLTANGAAVPAPAPALVPGVIVPPPVRNGPAAPAPSPVALGAALQDTAVGLEQTGLDWSSTPPPVRLTGPAEATTAPAAGSGEQPPAEPAPTASELPPAEPTPPPVLPAQPADPFLEAARRSHRARRGLGTRRGLYERLLLTRDLLRTWDQLGKYVGRPKRRLTTAAEAKDLARRLAKMDQLLLDFPPLVGQAGQPGYRVVILAREDHVAGVFKAQDEEAREALALDWKTGRAVLAAHLDFVRYEVRALRRQSWAKRAFRPVGAWINDHPGVVAVLAMLALALAVLSLGAGR